MGDDTMLSNGDDTGNVLDLEIEEVIGRVRFDAAGLVPAIVQDADSCQVLMMAWMDEDALRATLANRRATYYSRSRQRQWVKGETSGNVQTVRELRLDCDADTVLLIVDQQGAACHTGAVSCFDVGGRDDR